MTASSEIHLHLKVQTNFDTKNVDQTLYLTGLHFVIEFIMYI